MSDKRRVGIGPSFTIDVSETAIAQEGIEEVRRQVRRIYEAAHRKRMADRAARIKQGRAENEI